MIVGTPSLRPRELALGLRDGQVVDAGIAQLHETDRVELPVLVAVRAIPVVCIVPPFIRKAHGDAVVRESPQLLDEPILQLAAPLARQELDDLIPAYRKFRAVTP